MECRLLTIWAAAKTISHSLSFSSAYTVQHTLSCKKEFVTLRHNKLRNIIDEMLQEVTKDVRLEPILQPLTGEEQSIGGNVSMEERADISVSGFWWRGQRSFFNIKIFDTNA